MSRESVSEYVSETSCFAGRNYLTFYSRRKVGDLDVDKLPGKEGLLVPGTYLYHKTSFMY